MIVFFFYQIDAQILYFNTTRKKLYCKTSKTIISLQDHQNKIVQK